MSSPHTLLNILQLRAQSDSKATAFVFLPNGEEAAPPLTYSQLWTSARKLGDAIMRRHVRSGDRVLLLLPTGYEFLYAFFGCHLAGAVPVPIALPRRARGTAVPLVDKICEDCDPALVLTSASLAAQLETGHFRAAAKRPKLLLESILDETGSALSQELPGPADVSHLQYTSGSTDDPRGVIITQGNVLAALAVSEAAFGLSRASRLVSWLPHYHDMGLIGTYLSPIYTGYPCVFMPPHAFAARPSRWLHAISASGATVAGGPNVAYELAGRVQADEAARYDLSRWECAFNGSEPVRQSTLERFSSALRGSGFSPTSFRPCYGLAEATLQVSGGPIGKRVSLVHLESGKTIFPFVSCGRIGLATETAVIDPITREPMPGGEVGELWVAGPQVAAGYWNKPELTASVFHARVAGRSDMAYLRTGDLGFVCAGEVYVVGRIKDTLIINGVNHAPEPIERSVEETCSALRPGSVAAVAVLLETREGIAIAGEVSRASSRDTSALKRICSEVRAAVHKAHDLPVHQVILAAELALPRTTSGKLRRAAIRDALKREELPHLYVG